MGCCFSTPKTIPSAGFKSIPYTATTPGPKPMYYNPHNGHTHRNFSSATHEEHEGDYCLTCQCTRCVDRRAKGFKWSHRKM
ncbi:hypothetical protein J3F84DRAFT_383664 [Trichoderma pleuroticola]